MALMKPRQPALFNEASVSYSFDEDSITEYGFQPFEYGWEYKPTKTKGTHLIYTFSENGLKKLIAHWNRSEDWHYTLKG